MRAVGNGGGNWLKGVPWAPDSDENLMTEVSPKVYEITYTNVDANVDSFEGYQVKFAANGSWAAFMAVRVLNRKQRTTPMTT